jgi:hypothetical protein
MWYVMLYAMSLCYDYVQQDTDVATKSSSQAPLMPIYLSISFILRRYKDNLPNNDMRPVPDAKQVMTNINRFQEQVW